MNTCKHKGYISRSLGIPVGKTGWIHELQFWCDQCDKETPTIMFSDHRLDGSVTGLLEALLEGEGDPAREYYYQALRALEEGKCHEYNPSTEHKVDNIIEQLKEMLGCD